jgi:hypothetical protein
VKVGTIFVCMSERYDDQDVMGVYRVLKAFDMTAELERRGLGPRVGIDGRAIAGRARGVTSDGRVILDMSSDQYASNYSPQNFMHTLRNEGYVEEVDAPIFDMGDESSVPRAFEDPGGDQWVRACAHEHEDCLAHPELSAACGERELLDRVHAKVAREAADRIVSMAIVAPPHETVITNVSYASTAFGEAAIGVRAGEWIIRREDGARMCVVGFLAMEDGTAVAQVRTEDGQLLAFTQDAIREQFVHTAPFGFHQ